MIDVVHEIPRGDVRAGALALLRAIQYLPEGVVLAVVDPGVGTSRRPIAAQTEWGYFVGPDNGLLAPAVAMVGGADFVVALEDPRFTYPRRERPSTAGMCSPLPLPCWRRGRLRSPIWARRSLSTPLFR